MKKQEVIVIESNSVGNGAAALEAAKRLGFIAHFVTADPSSYAAARKDPTRSADIVSTVATDDAGKLLHFVAGRDVASVLAFTDYETIQAAIVGEYLGLRTPPVKGIVACRFKDLFRRASAGCGWTPRFATTPFDAPDRTSPVGYPCVVKPVDESGSVGVKICRDDGEFSEALGEIRAVSKNSFGYTRARTILVEEYIPGPEYSAEMAWNPGQGCFVLIGVTKKEVSAPPYNIELGHTFPHEEIDLACVERQIGAALVKVGLRNLVCHVEFKPRETGVAIIEVNARIGGDCILDLVKLSTGIDLAQLQLEITLGRFDSAENRAAAGRYAAVRFALPPKPGTVRSFGFGSGPNIVEKYAKRTPLSIARVASNDERLGAVIAVGATAAEAGASAEHAVSGATIEYQS